MKKNYFLILFVAIAIKCFSSSNVQYDKNIEIEFDNLKVVKLTGTPYNRGYIHGSTLKEEINEIISLWKDNLGKTYNCDPNMFIDRFYKETNYIPSITKWTPELLDEIKGLAHGCGIDFETMFVFQLADEEWANGRDIPAEHCTTIGVNAIGNQAPINAGSMDINPYNNKFQTLLHIIDESTGLESFVFAVAGSIGLNGMNNKSVAVNVNTLSDLKNIKEGLPVAFVVRGILAQETEEEAENFLRSIVHASGQNYLVSGKKYCKSFECCTDSVAEFKPNINSNITYHTNFSVVNSRYEPRYLKRLADKGYTIEYKRNRCTRFPILEEEFLNNNQFADLDKVKRVMSRNDDVRVSISNDWTMCCTIYITGTKPELHIAPGRTHLTPFIVFRFLNN